MYYSIPSGIRDKYNKDKDGNVKFVEVDGMLVPSSAGGKETSYSEPIKFMASISSKLNELHAEAYGVSQSDIYSEICLIKGQIPLKYGMKIWLHNPIEFLISEENGEPNVDSADYTVKGFMNEFIDYDYILLQRNDS